MVREAEDDNRKHGVKIYIQDEGKTEEGTGRRITIQDRRKTKRKWHKTQVTGEQPSVLQRRLK